MCPIRNRADSFRRAASLTFDRDVLLDVSRPIWRAWRGKLPTGIDRVCLAYLEHFKDRAKAVVQRKGLRVILSNADSDRLFRLILAGSAAGRLDWIKLAVSLLPTLLRREASSGSLYLNVGHTGLDDPSLPQWISDNRLRAVFMVHDLIPLTHPEFCREGEPAKHKKRMANMVASATGIIGNSAATLFELEQYAASHGSPLPPSIAALIAGHQPHRREAATPTENPYFITLGTIEGRKNHLLLLRVWKRFVRDLGPAAPKLVIVGQRGWEADKAFQILDEPGDLDNFVVEMSDCDDDQLAGLIAGSRALLMPSFVEGFGLPVVEALQLGAPVIASDLPVYRELAGEIPTFLDPHDEDSWDAMIRRFAGDDAERERQLAAMPSYSAPSWPEHFRQVEAWLETIV